MSFKAFGAPTNVRVIGGASRVNGEPINQVWGAMVGRADNSLTEPYDNCTVELSQQGDSFEGCNPLRVNGNTLITITFQESETLEQNVAPIAIIKPQGTTTNIQQKVVREPDLENARIGENQTGTLSFTWGDLCRTLQTTIDEVTYNGEIENTGDINRCMLNGKPTSGNFLVTYGFQSGQSQRDTNSTTILPFFLYSPPLEGEDGFAGSMPQGCSGDVTGICEITPFPGDQGGTLNAPEGYLPNKINQIAGSTTLAAPAFDAFGSTSQSLPLTIEKLRMYYSTIDFLSAHPSENPGQIIELLLDVSSSTTTAVFREADFGGLENGVSYILRGSTVDVSGTISRVFASDFCPGGELDTPAQCPDYSITPSEIAGLITDSSCFITSATYGSPQAHQVTIFRQFRAKYLWPNQLGRFISRTYNRYGPAGAKWVYENPSSKRFVRMGLYPFYGFAYLSVKLGFLAASLIYLMSLVVVALGLIKILSKGKLQ